MPEVTTSTWAVPGLLADRERLEVFELGRPLESSTPVAPVHTPFRMGLVRRHGDVVLDSGHTGASELLTLGGHTGTHVDALSHVGKDGVLHGGVDAAEAARGGRFAQLGVDTVPPMLCRGVLLDVPRAHGREQLDAGEAVTAAMLEATCAHQDVAVGAGDAVLIRTGWPVGRYEDAAAYASTEHGMPGPDASGGEWLAARGILATGTDTIMYEWWPPQPDGPAVAVHDILLRQAGIYILEVLDLERVAGEGLYAFLFVCLPLRIVGATGSPIRPIAVAERRA